MDSRGFRMGIGCGKKEKETQKDTACSQLGQIALPGSN